MHRERTAGGNVVTFGSTVNPEIHTMRTRNILPASTALACLVSTMFVTPIASADDGPWYVSVTGGWTLQGDQSARFSASGQDTGTDLELSSGFLAGAAIGKHFGERWRIELEYMYQSVDQEGLALPGTAVSGDGNFASTSVGANLLYDLTLADNAPVQPWVGLGLAWLTEVDIDIESANGEVSFSGNGFAPQVMAGLRFRAFESVKVDVGLRYLLARDLDLDGEGRTQGEIQADYAPFAITAGVVWKF